MKSMTRCKSAKILQLAEFPSWGCTVQIRSMGIRFIRGWWPDLSNTLNGVGGSLGDRLENMANKLHSKAIKAYIEVTGKQFCTNCRIEQDKNGGVWIVSSNGLNRRWKCKACHLRAVARGASTWKRKNGFHIVDSLTNQPAVNPAIAGRKNDHLPSPGVHCQTVLRIVRKTQSGQAWRWIRWD